MDVCKISCKPDNTIWIIKNCPNLILKNTGSIVNDVDIFIGEVPCDLNIRAAFNYKYNNWYDIPTI
jgi:hypothetical protein